LHSCGNELIHNRGEVFGQFIYQKSGFVNPCQIMSKFKNATFLQVPLLMSTITHIFPMIFDLIGRAEKHHARTALRLHLIRISALYIINYVTLMYSLFEKLDAIRSKNVEEEEEEEEEQMAAQKWQWRRPSGQKVNPPELTLKVNLPKMPPKTARKPASAPARPSILQSQFFLSP
jgi:hypothetical protein